MCVRERKRQTKCLANWSKRTAAFLGCQISSQRIMRIEGETGREGDIIAAYRISPHSDDVRSIICMLLSWYV